MTTHAPRYRIIPAHGHGRAREGVVMGAGGPLTDAGLLRLQIAKATAGVRLDVPEPRRGHIRMFPGELVGEGELVDLRWARFGMVLP